MRVARPLDIVIFGLSITSAWGNGHATTYRALVRALARRGHRVRFFERDTKWYADNRDLPKPAYCDLRLYSRLEELERHATDIGRADVVIVGSYVPEGSKVIEWLLPRVGGLISFYDIDTPVTVAQLERAQCEYLTAALVPQFDLYLSFSGGPVLQRLQQQFGARRARPLYCSVDPNGYFPVWRAPKRYDMGYLGTYSADRQAALALLLLEPARLWPGGAFCVAGSQYPKSLVWPANVARVEHLGPAAHRGFYNSQRLTLNITRADMVASGYSPSVRLFEAAACGVPIVTDDWPGLETFFTPGREILVARSTQEALGYIRDVGAAELEEVAARARSRVLAHHTADHRACELEGYVWEAAAEWAMRRSGAHHESATQSGRAATVQV